MPRKKIRSKRIPRLRYGQNMLLTWGIALDGTIPFKDENERRLAWKANRQRLIEEFRQENPGQRPQGFWDFDLKRPRPDNYIEEAEELHKLNLLEPWEVAEINRVKRILDGKPSLKIVKIDEKV